MTNNFSFRTNMSGHVGKDIGIRIYKHFEEFRLVYFQSLSLDTFRFLDNIKEFLEHLQSQ